MFASANTELIIDINGYFAEGVVTSIDAAGGITGGGTGSVSLGLDASGHPLQGSWIFQDRRSGRRGEQVSLTTRSSNHPT